MHLTTIERARRYVGKCPPAISGQGGHSAAYRVAAVLVNGFGLIEADAMMLFREWNRTCLPLWSETELQHKVGSVVHARHAQPRGHLLGDDGGGWSNNTGRNGAATLVAPRPARAAATRRRWRGCENN